MASFVLRYGLGAIAVIVWAGQGFGAASGAGAPRSAEGAAAQSAPSASGPVKADYDQLLGGLEKIAITGIPGSYCLLSPQAMPLVAGAVDKKLAPVVAGLRMGKGRVVAFAHNGYFGSAALQWGDTGRLMLNAVRWSAGDAGKDKGPRVAVHGAGELRKFLSDKGVNVLPDGKGRWKEQLGSSDVFCIEAGDFGRDDEIAAIRAFIEKGGGLIVAGCPWGWAQVTGRPLRTEYPVNRLLGPAGIVAAETYTGTTVEGGFAVKNPPPRLLHVEEALELLAGRKGTAAPGKEELTQASFTLTTAAHSVEPNDELLLPRLRTLRKDFGGKLVPLPDSPVKESDGLARVLVALEDMELRSTPAEKVKAHPSAKGFPYDVPADAKRVARELAVDTSVPDWHSTGLYAAPGEVIEVTVPEPAAGKGLGVRIGPHTDTIWHLNSWQRWPSISWHQKITGPVTRIASPFGGLIYIEAPRNAGLGTVSVRIASAVEAPYYVLGKTDANQWRSSIRNRPAPWAELESPGIILTVPSKVVRNLDDPEELMKFWNRVIELEDELACWKSGDRKRPERMLTDQQISAGYMHSGYPVMTFLDVIETNVSIAKLTGTKDKPAGWGQWHELGHNHQSGDWTPSGTGEVTVNLFSMYVINKLHGVPLDGTRPEHLMRAKRQAHIRRYLSSQQTPSNWDPFTGLVMYYQLIDAFGWETLKKVIAGYRDLRGGERPRNDVQKWDQWMVRYSKATGKNLGPFFQKWRVPVSQSAVDSIKDLPAWMHEDFAQGEDGATTRTSSPK